MPPPPNSAFLITTVTRRFGSYSASIICDLGLDPPTHIVLSRDRSAFLRDTLLSFGLRLDHSFDAWIFLSNPNNPISILNPDSSHRGANGSDLIDAFLCRGHQYRYTPPSFPLHTC
ncbi:hypothetical protein DFH09DRAFT_1360644 [Mycena vulgaris]|nr:hypothetical protein DFH09DRAFT_1360644 [Mycena vulgaris]